MKKIVVFFFAFLVLVPLHWSVFAQTPEPELDDDVDRESKVVLTPSGSAFKNGSADGKCTIADAACTTAGNAPGICIDNGEGKGVCTSVTPTIDPLFDTGCGPDDICHIKPEKVARDVRGSQPENKNCGKNNCEGEWWEPIRQLWEGEVVPDGLYHYGTDLLKQFGFQIQDASYQDLTPAELQNITLHDVQKKRFCMTSRICIYNPVTGELVGNFLTEETICTDDPPARKELIEGTRRLASYTTNYSSSTDYRLPNTVVKKIAALECGKKLEDGREMELNDITYIKRNYYGDDAITEFGITIQAHMVSLIERFIDELGKYVSFYQATEHTPAVEKGSAENSMAASLAGVSFSVTREDLKDFGYPSDAGKEQLTKVGGLWNTYRNDAYDEAFKSPLHAIYEEQDWIFGIKGFGKKTAPTLQSMNARQENAQLFGNCTILPAGLQNKVFANGECNQSWVAESSESSIASISPSDPDNPTSSWALVPNGSSVNPISPGFKPPSSITAGNALALVPACVLEGVAQIEGAYEGGAPCSPNECGAYGPFQITTGNCKPSCGASSCPNAAQQLGVTKDDLCDFNTAAYHAARLLTGKSKYFGFPLTNADPKTQKQAIIIAGDSYYGTPKPVARLGGMSYGEWVYAHCDPTYKTHVDHAFPTPPNPL